MKRIEVQGVTELTGRFIKFGCKSEPYALPEEIVRVVLQKGKCEAIVRVNSLGENGRCTGTVIDYVHFHGAARRRGFVLSQPKT